MNERRGGKMSFLADNDTPYIETIPLSREGGWPEGFGNQSRGV
jgi:hypothetical protein